MSKPANESKRDAARFFGTQLRYVSTRRIRKLKKRGVSYRRVESCPNLWSWLRPL